MKRLITTAAIAMLSAVGAYAQGTIVFANGTSSLVVWDAALGGGAIPATAGIKVGLYYNGTGGFVLVPKGVNPYPPYLGTTSTGATNTAVNGRFNAGTLAVPGLAGGATGTFQVRAWSGGFESYEAAVAGGAQYLASTADFLNGSGGPTADPNAPPIPAATLSGFTGLVVPEPSTIALAALGLGAMCLIRRRK